MKNISIYISVNMPNAKKNNERLENKFRKINLIYNLYGK